MIESLFVGLAVLASAGTPLDAVSGLACGPQLTDDVVRIEASFAVVSSAGREEYQLRGPSNLVFCRRASDTMTWIRLATSVENDGSESAHLDIDICHLPDEGLLDPMVARAQPCPGGATWALWWHDENSGVFANDASSTSCELNIEREGDRLLGTFACLGLLGDDGETRVDVVDGHFACLFPQASGTRK